MPQVSYPAGKLIKSKKPWLNENWEQQLKKRLWNQVAGEVYCWQSPKAVGMTVATTLVYKSK